MLKSYSFRLEEDTVKDYDIICEARGVERSTLVREILEKALIVDLNLDLLPVSDCYKNKLDKFNKDIKNYNGIEYGNFTLQAKEIVAKLDPNDVRLVIIEGSIGDKVVFNLSLPIKELYNIKMVKEEVTRGTVKEEVTRRMNLG